MSIGHFLAKWRFSGRVGVDGMLFFVVQELELELGGLGLDWTGDCAHVVTVGGWRGLWDGGLHQQWRRRIFMSTVLDGVFGFYLNKTDVFGMRIMNWSYKTLFY